MEPLIQHDIFNSVRDSIQFFVKDTINGRRSILLVSKPNLEGALSIAPIEAALLDAGIPYKRRFTDSGPNYAPFIQISDDSDTAIKDPSGLAFYNHCRRIEGEARRLPKGPSQLSCPGARPCYVTESSKSPP